MVESSLVLVSVPIGNSQDITERANETLASAQVIVAEDTRVLKELLQSLNINYSDKNIFSFHDHSGDQGIKGILSLIQKGQSVVYVSDAGSPIISDPAYPLIRAVLEADLNLVSIPGVSSLLVALELSGLPASPFSFIGFLPREKIDLRKRLDTLNEGMTYIFFEAPHRIE
jgi:16S rRNA (cytidine1402-2'-O)-methyltransferase